MAEGFWTFLTLYHGSLFPFASRPSFAVACRCDPFDLHPGIWESSCFIRLVFGYLDSLGREKGSPVTCSGVVCIGKQKACWMDTGFISSYSHLQLRLSRGYWDSNYLFINCKMGPYDIPRETHLFSAISRDLFFIFWLPSKITGAAAYI